MAAKRQMVDTLLRHGAEHDQQNSKGRAAVMLSAFFGHVRVVDTLVRHGATIDLVVSALMMWSGERRTLPSIESRAKLAADRAAAEER